MLTMSLTPTFVALGGEPLMLTRVEERLLARLWAGPRRGHLLGRARSKRLMGRQVTSHTLRVHLSQLRQSFERSASSSSTLC